MEPTKETEKAIEPIKFERVGMHEVAVTYKGNQVDRLVVAEAVTPDIFKKTDIKVFIAYAKRHCKNRITEYQKLRITDAIVTKLNRLISIAIILDNFEEGTYYEKI